MFAGEHICKLDEKGRFVLPPPMREILESQGKRLVYLKGSDSCLWAYAQPEWSRILEQGRADLDEDESRLFMHHVVSEMTVADIDKGGRVLIPGKMRKHLNLDVDVERTGTKIKFGKKIEVVGRETTYSEPSKSLAQHEIVLIGLYQKLELWSLSSWSNYLASNEEKLESAQARFLEFL